MTMKSYKADRDGVFFETSSGSVVYMEHDEVVTALNECVLLPVVDLDDDVEDEDEDEDEDGGD